MKIYRETYIRKAEIAQLVLLHQLYAQSGSHELIFQGGTALRWCYGGSRFSEDLDFVTPLSGDIIRTKLNRALKGIENTMIPHFGMGVLAMTDKTARSESLKLFLNFHPERSREKISVKLEFERLAADAWPKQQKHILSALPPVAYMIASGEFRIPRPHVVLVAETPAEIISDKIRSLLERRYLKGRDLYDVWHLCTVLKTSVDMDTVKKKFDLYRAPFVLRRSMDFFTAPTGEDRKTIIEALERDLSRFLPPEALSVSRADQYDVFLDAVRRLFLDLKDKGLQFT
ncbi:MAG: hypothetical protein C0394_00060 [Syntrophus sp. (in: bacteria)]|nr:hypothetical protein [Syntrophus sp. (in: bacteria)]